MNLLKDLERRMDIMIKTINKFTIKSVLSCGYELPILQIKSDPEGDWIRVEDLNSWIEWHLKSRSISTVYSDFKQAIED